jgi:hypothetical protein
MTQENKIQGLNKFLGEYVCYIDEQFKESVERIYCHEHLDFRPEKWNKFIEARVKGMWFIFSHRN